MGETGKQLGGAARRRKAARSKTVPAPHPEKSKPAPPRARKPKGGDPDVGARANTQAPRPLNAKQALFVKEYLVDLNATQAAIRAGYSAKTAGSIGERLLKHVEIAAAVEAAIAARSERTDITADMVLRRWWDIANVDVNDLIEFRRQCCRYCHGIEHGYQWRDLAEFERDTQAVMMANAIAKDGTAPRPLPLDTGGYGFKSTLPPHADCPQCDGNGLGDAHFHDTRTLKGPARLLYNGVKITQGGIEMKLLDRDKALDNVAKHLGMFIEKSEVEHSGGVVVEIVRFGDGAPA